MVGIGKATCEKNDKETIVDNDGILSLNEKNIEERLNHNNVREITTKYHSDHRKRRYELIDEPKRQCNIIFAESKLAMKVSMDYRIKSAHKFRTKFEFKQYDVISIKKKKKSVLTNIMQTRKYANKI